MSWNDIYPVMWDEMVEEFETLASPAERATMEEWFGVERILNPRESGHVVAVSLFWKNVDLNHPDLPPVTEELMRGATANGLATRFAPWDHYVRPLLEGAATMRKEIPDACVRVYLANDMAWLADRLAEVGCEVRVMKHSSLRHMPGALWRFLAMEDAGDLVSFMDSDRLASGLDLVRAAVTLTGAELPTWRRPNAGAPEIDAGGYFVYRSIIAWPLATRSRLPMRALIEAFVWQSLRGAIPEMIDYPDRGPIPYFGTRWPGYGFDEWFLSVAVYPRLAAGGMVTDIHSARAGFALGLDLEYSAWANPRNETATPLRMLEGSGARRDRGDSAGVDAMPTSEAAGQQAARAADGGRMLQFGTSGNVLDGWENFDLPDVDISRRLPFPDAAARFIFLEHVIEHVTAREAWNFFGECRRVLAPGGVLRLAFPDMVKIFRSAAPCYHEFIARQGWGDGSPGSSVRAVLFEHGHQAGWTVEGMLAVLEAQGFESKQEQIGRSDWPELRRIEQHGNAVGHDVTAAETVVVEAVNRNPLTQPAVRADWGLPEEIAGG